MIKEKFKSLREKSKKICLKTSVVLGSVGAIIMMNSMRVFAAAPTGTVGGDTQIQSQDANTVASRIFTANQGIATAFGGALIGIAVVIIGIKMIMASKKQEARSEAMDSIMTVIIAALLIGGFAIFAGLFWGWGTK